MARTLLSGSSGPGSSPSSPGRAHCVVFLGKTLCSYSASLYPGVYALSSHTAGAGGGGVGGCWNTSSHFIFRIFQGRSFLIRRSRGTRILGIKSHTVDRILCRQ